MFQRCAALMHSGLRPPRSPLTVPAATGAHRLGRGPLRPHAARRSRAQAPGLRAQHAAARHLALRG